MLVSPGAASWRRFHAGHAFVLLFEYVGAQLAASLLVETGYELYAALTATGQTQAAAIMQAVKPAMLLYSVVAGIVIGVIVVTVQVRLWARWLLADGSARGIAWVRPAWSAWLHGLAAGLALACLVDLYLVFVAPPDPQALNGPLAELARGGLAQQLALIALALIVAPLIEEFLFRGAMFAGIARSWGPRAAVILTTLAFVGVHLPDKWHYWPGLIAVGLLGLLNCALRLRYRSLAPPIAAHFTYNIALMVLSAVL